MKFLARKKKRRKVTLSELLYKPIIWYTGVCDYSKNKLGSSALYTNSLCSKCIELLFIFIGQARRRSQEASLMGINEIVV